ncbi:MAG: stage 0 sporulation family protein, partial [Phycisphaerales bacterium]
MSIQPLPQFEEDLASYLKEKEDRDAYERLQAPSSIVVRFGYSMMVGEFPYNGEVKPGCGSKIVVRTQRGTELGEMLTSTCRNSGCSKSVSRKEMLEYIENSGGRKYPFYEQGKVIRVAEKADLDEQAKLEQSKNAMRAIARGKIKSYGLDMRLVEVEPILGGERVIVYFNSEERIDFRDLVKDLQVDFKTRVELVQVGARDEARIVADYERCGQYCCCKNFLKVLKPVSMKSAKIQKATLDPLKISGRCGRLMCCLRYEDETYDQLRKNLPHRKSRVGTPDGDGMVIDSQILTQLSKILLDDGTIVAVPIEELTAPVHAKAPEPTDQRPARREMRKEPRRDGSSDRRRESSSDRSKGGSGSGAGGGSGGGTGSGTEQADRPRRKRRRRGAGSGSASAAGADTRVDSGSDLPNGQIEPKVGGDPGQAGDDRPKRKRRRQGSKRPRRTPEERAQGQTPADGSASNPDQSTGQSADQSTGQGSGAEGAGGAGGPKKKRRRRRRRGGGGTGSGSDSGSGPDRGPD